MCIRTNEIVWINLLLSPIETVAEQFEIHLQPRLGDWEHVIVSDHYGLDGNNLFIPAAGKKWQPPITKALVSDKHNCAQLIQLVG